MKPIFNCLFLLFFSFTVYAQDTFTVMFYNVENLFDTLDNPDIQDDEFTPDGTRHWTNKRYYKKINNLAKVISSVGKWNFPALIGLCEIENDKVLKDLALHSPLKQAQYKYILTQSPDIRGINVALLYQRDQFKYLYHDCISLSFPYNKDKRTRDILHVTGLILTLDTLDVFICHFPSRRGGEHLSEPDRIYAASVLKKRTEDLFRKRKNAHLIIMGDFNDEPSNKSILQILKANPITYPIFPNELYNMMWESEKMDNIGSYKYLDQWNLLDQIIVSGNLLDQNRRFHASQHTACIFQKDYLFIQDTAHGGKRLKKTYHGYKYEGGYSDHLPVYLDFNLFWEK